MLFLCEHVDEQVELGITGYQNLSYKKQAIQISESAPHCGWVWRQCRLFIILNALIAQKLAQEVGKPLDSY